jgi:hypothetical protein
MKTAVLRFRDTNAGEKASAEMAKAAMAAAASFIFDCFDGDVGKVYDVKRVNQSKEVSAADWLNE